MSGWVLAGGDIGSAVSCVLASDYPQYCKSIHINFVPVPFSFGHLRFSRPWHILMYINARLPILNKLPIFISKEEMEYLECNNHFQTQESGALSLLQFFPILAICFTWDQTSQNMRDLLTSSKNAWIGIGSSKIGSSRIGKQQLILRDLS